MADEYLPAIPTVQVDDDRVRVTEWRIPKGAATTWHRHEMPYVVVPIKGGPGVGLEEITPSKYTQYMTGTRKGKAYAGVIGDKAVFYRRKFSRGGLVGLAQRNHGSAAAVAGLAYLLGTNSAARGAASMMSPVPAGELNPASREALEYAQYQGSGTNPLTKDTWG